MRWLVCAALLGACYSPPSLHCAVSCGTGMAACPGELVCGVDGLCQLEGVSCGSTTADASADADADADARPDGNLDCYGRTSAPFFRVCPPMFQPPTTLAGASILDTGSTCPFVAMQSGREICVFAYQRFEMSISATLQITGPRPALVLGRTAITISTSAIIDAASRTAAGKTGPNADQPCAPGTPASDTNEARGAGGGAGGSFQFLGGTGGAAATVDGGKPGAVVPPVVLRGGCRGGRGGNAAVIGPEGGSSGGAIYLMSDGPITIDGMINASGAGGLEPEVHGGGPGGGSGGMIVLDGQSLVVSTNASLFAHGGGGAAGGGELSRGVAGQEAAGATAPPGTTTNGNAGTGGGSMVSGQAIPGGTGAAEPCEGSTGGCGGGGGGGGGGYIIIPMGQTLPSSVALPPPTYVP